MYSNIKLCRCQLQLHQSIDKKVVYQTLKSPVIEMIAWLNFNIQMIYLSKKGREKGRDWTEI
ncbi:FanG protein [Streptococcus sp. 116-D4]|uniref:FanG protein n=1 Tax=Streptococcus sp. 116-D4 TaxID=2598453 RepID=UPI001E4A587D|nr:FanG protein [Streptococcus sp. 116-D4]